MSRSIMTFLAGAIAVLLLLADRGLGDERTLNDASPRDYRELIRQLVSPNEKAVTDNGETITVKFPAGYDVKAQHQIHAVRQLLYDNFEVALPFLVGALDDDRYCMTIAYGHDGYHNRSVGHVCRDVIAVHLQIYSRLMRFSGPVDAVRCRYSLHVVSKEWWRSRKERSVAELQVEAIDWVIERRKVEGTTKTSERRVKEISDLQHLRDEIAKSGKPAKAGRMEVMITSDQSS